MQRMDMEKYMQLAISEAEKASGMVSPNPMVGALLMKNQRIIGVGHHSKSGCSHAEIEALESCNEDLEGVTLFCTLEPCCHTNKKTPPCAPAIVSAGIKKVVISNLDPNPLVCGGGVEFLRKNGVEVVIGVLEKEGARLNEVFFHHIKKKVPFIHLKAAQSLDGRIQSVRGDSKWISNEGCRTEAHALRKKYDCVLIGRKTLNNDNPRLDIRMNIESEGKLPYRVILGKPSKFNWDSYILKNNIEKNIYLVGNDDLATLPRYQTEVLEAGHIIKEKNLEDNMKSLYELGITSVLVEGGSEVLSSFFKEELFNRLTLFQAPILIGNGEGIYKSLNTEIRSSLKLELLNIELIENNIKIELEKKCSQE